MSGCCVSVFVLFNYSVRIAGGLLVNKLTFFLSGRGRATCAELFCRASGSRTHHLMHPMHACYRYTMARYGDDIIYVYQRQETGRPNQSQLSGRLLFYADREAGSGGQACRLHQKYSRYFALEPRGRECRPSAQFLASHKDFLEGRFLGGIAFLLSRPPS